MEDKLARAIAEMLTPAITEVVKQTIREVAPASTAPVTVYTVEEAAKLLRTSRDQILAYIRSGKLASFKLERDSRKNLIHSSDLMDLVERLKQAG